MTAQLAQELAEFLPEAANLTAADLAESGERPVEPAPQAVDVDFAGAGSHILKAFGDDSLKDSLTVFFSQWTKAFRLSWRGQSIDGVVAVRANDDGVLVTRATGTKLVLPLGKAAAEFVEVQAQPAPGPSPVGQSIAAYLGK